MFKIEDLAENGGFYLIATVKPATDTRGRRVKVTDGLVTKTLPWRDSASDPMDQAVMEYFTGDGTPVPSVRLVKFKHPKTNGRVYVCIR